jgi:solute carrier family 45, member 1/2/4
VGEIYYRYEHPAPEPGQKDEHDALGNIGRLGSMALVCFSLITFCSSIALPYMIKSLEASQTKYTPRPPAFLGKSLQNLLVKAHMFQPDLTSAWGISNLLFAMITISAPWIRTLSGATSLVASCGLPWAVSCWAPFALLGIEINKMSSDSHETVYRSSAPGYTAVRGSTDEGFDFEADGKLHHRHLVSDGVLRLNHSDDGATQSSTGELAGVYLGVLNVYTTLPQFVGTFISWVVFSFLEPNASDHDAETDPDHHRWLSIKKSAPNAIAICMFIGALCALASVEASRRLKRMG